MEIRSILDAMVLALGLTPGLLVAFTAHLEFGLPIPVAILLGLAGAKMASKWLMAPIH
ncbi:MAG: hypothetical protein OSB42_13045 [Planctomycetota bacterium]|nr:hypothetical protein [Planctomycetota bacterium]